MNNYNHSLEHITEKQTRLELARITLKKEFVGIDDVIDQVIQSVSNWYLFPQLQERPVVVNLWGMTGVGKTALVKRLVELLDYSEKYFRFDMGNAGEHKSSMKEILKRIFRHNSGEPYILMMDEFQFARTMNEDEEETGNSYSRVIWDLLDSGKLETLRNVTSELENFARLKSILEQCLEEGVKVNGGIVTEQQELFFEIIADLSDDLFDFAETSTRHTIKQDGKEVYSFLPLNLLPEMYQYWPEQKMSFRNFKKKVYGLNGPEIIQLIKSIMDFANGHRIMDCSKTIIFILGNLDAAYCMSRDMNPDVDADDFHKASLNIGVNHIKRSLAKLFRMEQISRLGNNHIIYPAFNRNSYMQLIDLELNKFQEKYFKKFGVSFEFSKSFRDVLYNEGVYPTQGTRPLFSTIYQLVNAKIPNILGENLLKQWKAKSILFDADRDMMVVKFFSSNDTHELRIPMQLKLRKLREPSRDDMQAITAVHESGHAVITIAARKIVPDMICSTTADAGSNGFVTLAHRWNYFSKEEGLLRIAELMGGFLAEKIIFGEGKVTSGAEEDIARATDLATSIIKDYGMGEAIATIDLYAFQERDGLRDAGDLANEEVKQLLRKGCELAEKVLLEERHLLLHLADHLSDERMLDKEGITEMVKKFGSNTLRQCIFIEDGSHLFYRECLKAQVNKSPVIITPKLDKGEVAISLNSIN